jgi:hypothetical protein
LRLAVHGSSARPGRHSHTVDVGDAPADVVGPPSGTNAVNAATAATPTSRHAPAEGRATVFDPIAGVRAPRVRPSLAATRQLVRKPPSTGSTMPDM